MLNNTPLPHTPHQVLIGPIGPRAGRPGPLDPPAAAAFLDGASDGAAVVSFGSVPLFGAMFLTKDDYVQLALAFADLAPVRVLWLLKRRNWPEGMTQEELPLGDNTLIVEWVVSGRGRPSLGGVGRPCAPAQLADCR